MKHFLISLILVFFVRPSISAPPDIPEYVQAYFDTAGLEFELPTGKFESHLKSFLDEQGIPEPWAIVGDFNGDKFADWAGLLRDTNHQLILVVVYSEKSEFSHRVLAPLGADDDGIYTGVELKLPGEVHGIPVDGKPPPIITLTNPGIHLFYFEKSSILYYWDKDSFNKIWTSD